MARRAFMPRAPRGMCPSCGKLGLGVARTMYSGRQVRECRYCGEYLLLTERKAEAR
jgi:hypothetical protein